MGGGRKLDKIYKNYDYKTLILRKLFDSGAERTWQRGCCGFATASG
jgi:hypothetical protein